MFLDFRVKLTAICIFISLLIGTNGFAQKSYQYGTVLGGDDSGSSVTSYLQDNEEGYRVTLINSSGNGRGGNINQSSGGVTIMEVPKDTDYLELLVFYANLNPRNIRKNKIKIFRVKDAGDPPYQSENIKRYWTSYNFKDQYDKGGPFDEVKPGDIIIVQRKGLINRPFFDPLTDLRFILTLPSLALSVYTIYNAFKK